MPSSESSQVAGRSSINEINRQGLNRLPEESKSNEPAPLGDQKLQKKSKVAGLFTKKSTSTDKKQGKVQQKDAIEEEGLADPLLHEEDE